MKTHKQCNGCKLIKPLEDFQKAVNGKSGRRTMCKLCCSLRYNSKERYEKRNAKRREKRQTDPEYRKHEGLLIKEANRKDPISFLLRTARHRAKKKNIEFSIKREDLVLPEFCPLLNIKLQINDNRMKANSYSLDRIDNTKGYIPGNVWIISLKANKIKSDASLEELELLIKNLKIHWEH